MTDKKSSGGSVRIDGKTTILVADGEDGPTRLAADFLARDIEKITGSRPEVSIALPRPDEPCIFIASAGNDKAAETLRRLGVRTDEVAGKWEAYLFHTADGSVVICGGDSLGAMRGVYGFCRIALGVDPFYRWTGIEPVRRKRIALTGLDRTVGAPTFQFRGWFLNSGKLIRWNLGRGPESDLGAKFRGKIDAGISGTYGREMAEMIVETCLRADVNTIIPVSCLNLDEPDEKALADLCSEFGVFLSHHHLEPVGANLRGWEEFWKRRGEPVPEMSFYKNPEKFEIWWQHYIDAWSKYPRVVWCIGHRGPGDRPFWLRDEHCPDNLEAHGKAVSDAMAMQLRLIKQACGDRPIHYCATLWQDGARMHAADKLRFPPGTMVLMADHGGKQMMQEDFYRTPRRAGIRYGVYYHVCYGPGGPRWAEGASIDKMWFNLQELVQRGETAMVLLNVGSIRPYLPTLAGFSEMTTRGETFEPEQFLLDWCAAHYGPDHADQIAECYNAFFAAYIEPYHHFYEGHRGLWDGVLANECWRFFQVMYYGDLEEGYQKITRPFPSARVFMLFHKNKTAASLGAWDAVCDWGHRISEKLAGPAEDLFECNLVVQAEMMRALSYATHGIARAGLCLLEGQKDKAAECLKQARAAIETGWEYCVANGNRGVHTGWYTMHNIIDMDYLQVIDDMLDKLAGKEPATQADRDRVERFFSVPRQARWR